MTRSALEWLKGPEATVNQLLHRIRQVADQLEVGDEQRGVNQRGSMRADPGSGDVIIVDDVRTSGATVEEACRALTQSGRQVLAIVVLADAATATRWP